MSNRPTELPAYIQLRYREGDAFSQLTSQVANVTGVVRRDFENMAGAVDRAISGALSKPRGATGSLDLGLADMRESIRLQQARAAAADEYARAARRAVTADGTASRELREAAMAAEVLADKERAAATAAQVHADVLGRVQVELNREASAVDVVVAANRRLGASNDNAARSSGRHNQAMVGLGQQMQDAVIQAQMGTSALTIFAQQGSQAAFQMSGMGGAVGAVARTMAGPWGAAVFAGTALLGPLIAGLFGTGDEADKAAGSVAGLKDKLDLAKNSYESLTAVVKAYNEEQSHANALTFQAIIKAEDQAEANLKVARSQLARIQTSQKFFDENGGAIAAAAGGDVSALQTGNAIAYSHALSQVKALEKELNSASMAAGTERVRRRFDERYNLEVGYSEKIATLEEKRAKGLIKQVAYEEQRLSLLKQQKAALDAYDEAHKKGGATRSGETSSFVMPATGSITGKFGETRPGHTHGGVDIAVPVGTSIKAPGAGVVIEAGTLPGYGNVVFIDHGAGTITRLAHLSKIGVTKGQQVGQGDVIGLSGGAKGAEGSGNSQGPHLHYEVRRGGKAVNPLGQNYPTDAMGAAAKAQKAAEALAKAQEVLSEFGARSAESIARVNERFDEQPRLIDQAAAATRQLDALMAELAERKPEGFAQMIEDAKAAKTAVSDALLSPLKDMRRETERRLQMQSLIAQGHSDEASALQAVWSMEEKLGSEEALRAKVQTLITAGRNEEAQALEKLLAVYPEMKREAAAIAKVEAQRTRELERQRALFEAQLEVVDQAKRSLTDLLSGRGGNPLKEIGRALKDLQGKRLFDSLFGDVFQQLEAQLRGETPLEKESKNLATKMGVATTATEDLAKSFGEGSDEIRRAIASMRATNDNTTSNATGGSGLVASTLSHGIYDLGTTPGEIVVTAPREKKEPVELRKLSIYELAEKTAHGIVDPLLAGFGDILGTQFFSNLSGILSGALAGKMVGGDVGAVLGGLRGAVFDFGPDVFGKGMTEKVLGKFDTAIGGSQTGSMAAGLMKSLGIKTSTTGAQIGGALGSLTMIPGMDMVGSVIGGLIGGALKKVKWGRVDLTSGGASQAFGNSGKSKEAATAAGGSFNENLQNIIDQLGGTAGDFGSISLGVRHGDYRVNLGGTSLKKAKGAKDFDEDAEAAIKFALKEAIERGAVQGIRESSLRLLKAGDDLDKALKDALDWEGVFRELKGIKDPLGAALDDLDKEFERYIELAKAAGASTEEMADLQELYGIKQAQAIDDAKDRIVGSLKSLYEELTVGDSGLSLRDRRDAAMGEYEALRSRVEAGDTTAYDAYAEKAQALLDIERQLYGSQQDYFDRLNEVTDLTKSRIDAETNVVSIAENRDSPFDSAGAVNASINNQTDQLVSRFDALNDNQGTIIGLLAQIASNGGGLNSALATRIAFNSTF